MGKRITYPDPPEGHQKFERGKLFQWSNGAYWDMSDDELTPADWRQAVRMLLKMQ